MRYRSATVAGFHGLPWYPDDEKNPDKAEIMVPALPWQEEKHINIL